MHDVSFAEEEFRKICAILPGGAGDECNFVSHDSVFVFLERPEGFRLGAAADLLTPGMPDYPPEHAEQGNI